MCVPASRMEASEIFEFSVNSKKYSGSCGLQRWWACSGYALPTICALQPTTVFTPSITRFSRHSKIFNPRPSAPPVSYTCSTENFTLS